MIIDIVGVIIGLSMAAIVFHPLIIHIVYGWERKMNDKISSISPPTATIYLEKFQGLKVSEAN
jgi:hypothetical protein